MIIKRDERILDARYLSREGDTGTRWWSAMRGRNRLSVFNGSVVSSEVVLGGRPGQLVFTESTTALVYKPGATLGVFASLRMGFVGAFNAPGGYLSQAQTTATPITIPAGVSSIQFTVYLAAETTQYVGGTPISGTVIRGGALSPLSYDAYSITHKNALGATLNTYNLNYSASTVLNNVVLTSVFAVPTSTGDTFTFFNSNNDGVSGTALADNSRFGFVFSPLPAGAYPGKYEAGCVVTVQ